MNSDAPATAAPKAPDKYRKILIISYLFPPAGGIAVQRPLSFAKYLSRLGFEVHVLSAGSAASPVMDAGLLRHVPPEVTLHRAFAPVVPFGFRQRIWKVLSRGGQPGPKPASTMTGPPGWSLRGSVMDLVKQLICPDPEVVWVPFALRKATKIVKQCGIDTVLVTAPPFSAFLVGNALKRRFPHVRLISDFRDDWVGFYLQEFGGLNNANTVRRSKQMERTTAEQSDLVLVVTEAMLTGYRERYRDLAAGKFALIPNGYDPESFESLTRRKHAGSKVVFTFTGTVYSASSPRTYLEALQRLPDSIRTQVETRFVGRIADSEKPLLDSLRDDVQLMGFLPQNQALQYLQESDYLLLIMTDPGALTGKLFEYMATGKPILALAPTGGEIARILKETHTGWCVDPHDSAAIQVILQSLVERAQSGTSDWLPDWDLIRRYERPRLAEALAARIREF